jgi:hypothetical protein
MSTATSELLTNSAIFKVRRSLNTSGEGIQHMRLDVGTGTTESQVTTLNPLPVTVTGGSSSVQYTEDDVSVANPIGTQLVTRRRDALASETTTDGDVTANNSTAKGELYVKHVDSIPSTQSGTWVLGANNGVDIGDVTINNAAGAAAVNIQDGGNSITVDGSVSVSVISPAVAVTPASPTFTSVGVASTSVLAANASRKGLYLVNTSTATISLAFGATAVLNSGVTLYPQGQYWMDAFNLTVGTVNAIASAAASNLAVQEFN